jgi:hypothetical protein
LVHIYIWNNMNDGGWPLGPWPQPEGEKRGNERKGNDRGREEEEEILVLLKIDGMCMVGASKALQNAWLESYMTIRFRNSH